MNKKVQAMLDRAEDLGWEITLDEDNLEFGKHSPAGEDFFCCVGKTNNPNVLASQVREHASDFDTEEHVTMWVMAKQSGTSGIPSIKELVQDADDIQKMLDDLASALEEML